MVQTRGRLKRNYRIMWCDDSGAGASGYNPPITPEALLQISFGGLEGTPVDAYVATVGPCAGYTLSYPTEVPGMEFIVDRLEAGAIIGESAQWRMAENLRHLWALNCDPFALQIGEARRLGMDYWLQLRMNDWHHVDAQGQVYRLIGSKFYEENPQYLIGWEGTQGWPETLRNSMAWFQDFAHAPVRTLRLDVVVEACQRYDVDGFEYDFMRCPGFFKFGQEQANAALMTQLLRDTRAALDRIGLEKGKTLGLSVRVPNTIAGALRLGLDVPTWIEEELVDIVVPSTFFAADTGEDVTEWAELTCDTPVFINPAIEEGYSAGYTHGFAGVPYFQLKTPVMLPLTRPMISAIAARHLDSGADGLYVFNWGGTMGTYNCDHRLALDDIGDSQRLKFKDKRYVLMRRSDSFPNCLPTDRVLPAILAEVPLQLEIDIKDEVQQYAARVQRIRLLLLFRELTIADQVEVRLNGEILDCDNPLRAGDSAPSTPASWQMYDLRDHLPQVGKNEISIHLTKANEDFRRQVPLEITDVELEIDYRFPNGRWNDQR
jgi:hypothetical protein